MRMNIGRIKFESVKDVFDYIEHGAPPKKDDYDTLVYLVQQKMKDPSFHTPTMAVPTFKVSDKELLEIMEDVYQSNMKKKKIDTVKTILFVSLIAILGFSGAAKSNKIEKLQGEIDDLKDDLKDLDITDDDF